MRHRMPAASSTAHRAHRKAMFANMACALIKHEQIKTTLPKAKDAAAGGRKAGDAVAPRNGNSNLHARRQALSQIQDADR